MTRNTKIVKKITALFLVLLLSIDSFAAIVSDNDGSAFITKAEFDSLKNNFQQQLDQYNTSIDVKIDDAISNYLNGIKTTTVVELDSLLNKINAACGDGYYDSSGNKVLYNYRVMARKYNMPTTQKPIGAITNLFLMKADLLHQSQDNADYVGWTLYRLGMTYDKRTSFGDIIVPSDGTYQIGKYILYENGTYGKSPAHYNDDITYNFYASGSSFTYGVVNGPKMDDGWTGQGTPTIEEMKNENTYWSCTYGNAEMHWDNETSPDYVNWRTVYGTSYKENRTYSLFPISAVANDDFMGLRTTYVPRMTLQESSYNWTGFTQLGVGQRSKADKSVYKSYWSGQSEGGRTTIKFNFNCHPYEELNTADFVDKTASTLYEEPIKITDGLPICKVDDDGVIDMKLYLWRADGTGDVAFGLGTTRRANSYYSYYMNDTPINLRDFNDVSYGNRNTYPQGEHEFRVTVKKGDTLWIKTLAVGNDYGFSGAKTNELKLKVEK